MNALDRVIDVVARDLGRRFSLGGSSSAFSQLCGRWIDAFRAGYRESGKAQRLEFLLSLYELGVVPAIPNVRGSGEYGARGFREIYADELASIEDSDRAGELFYFCCGLPVVATDRSRFKGPLPLGANFTLDGMLAGTQVAAYRVSTP